MSSPEAFFSVPLKIIVLAPTMSRSVDFEVIQKVINF
jgi:hypothetical protein